MSVRWRPTKSARPWVFEMDWQTPVAVAVAALAGAYVLWRLARPFFQDKSHRDEPLQIGQSDD